jgi:ATP-dependent DNA helicase RecQ
MSTTHHFSLHQAQTLLAKHFGYAQFRKGQEEVIGSIVSGQDTLVIMPTGGGKSLCYQIPALLLPGMTLVISPLIALMQDQINGLARAGIRACAINSTLPFEEIRQRLHDAKFGKYKLLYIAPERLENKQFLESLAAVQQHLPISFLAVDEAHCVSEWGHDFRPAYLGVAAAAQAIAEQQGTPRLPVIALTATATPEVQEDIVRQLAMQSPQRFVRGFDRPNLVYQVETVSEKTPRLVDCCKDSERDGGVTIVYCGSRKRVEEFTHALRNHRVEAQPYHGGMNDKTRSTVLEQFSSGTLRTIVATNAFGMGVDKPNVRNVVHCDLTLSLEAYYQEAGRAGRDGLQAHCTLLYTPTDRKLMEFFLNATYPDHATLEKFYNVLYDLSATPRSTKPTEPVLLDETQLANRAGTSAASAAAALALFERYGVLRRGSTQGTARVQFLATRERLREYHDNIPPERRTVLNALFRLVGAAAYDAAVAFDVNDLWRKHSIPLAQFTEAVRAFEYARLVRYEPAGAAGGLTLLLERMPLNHLPVDWEGFAARRERAFRKLDTVQQYAETPECKRNVLLHYFGEYASGGYADAVGKPAACGKCSSCKRQQERVRAPRTARQEFLLQQLLSAAVELDGRFGKTVLAEVLKGNTGAEKVQKFRLHEAASFGKAAEFSKPEIVEAISVALRDGLLHTSADQYPTVQISSFGLAALTTRPDILHLQRYNREECLYPELLAQCTMLRTDVAALNRVADHQVIDDRTLITLVNALPRSREDIKRAVPRIGVMFMTRFAPMFLQTVQNFSARQAAKSGKDTAALSATVLATVECAREGLLLHDIAEQRGLSPGTVAQHLQEAIEQGTLLERRQFVADDLMAELRNLLQTRPELALRDVRLLARTECHIAELRIALAFARRELHELRIKH